MEHALKWLLPALVVVELVLIRQGVLDLSTALWVAILVELLLLLVAARQIMVAVRRYRRERKAGLDFWAAAEDGLTVLLPRPLARLVVMEPRMWGYLGQWLLRRYNRREGEFSYHKRSIVGALLILVFLTSPVELLLIELLVPWDWLRIALLVVAVYALLWVVAFYASLVVLPHRLGGEGLQLHYGALASGLIPYEAIARVEMANGRAPGGGDGLHAAPGGDVAYLAIGGRTQITLALRAPLALQGLLRPTHPVSSIHLAADEPQRLCEALSQRTSRSSDLAPGS